MLDWRKGLILGSVIELGSFSKSTGQHRPSGVCEFGCGNVARPSVAILLFNSTNAATTPVLAISVSPNPSDEGQNVNISGRLTDTSGNGLPGYYETVEWSPYNLGWTTLAGPFLTARKWTRISWDLVRRARMEFQQ